MLKSATADRQPGQLSPMAVRVSDAIRTMFEPMDMAPNPALDRLTELLATRRKWGEVLKVISEDILLDNGPWVVEFLMAGNEADFRVRRTLYDLAESWEEGRPTILPSATIEFLNRGASGVDVYVELPQAEGDYETFVANAMKAFAQVRKLAKFVNEEDVRLFGPNGEKAQEAARQQKEVAANQGELP